MLRVLWCLATTNRNNVCVCVCVSGWVGGWEREVGGGALTVLTATI